jgi:hypothetical protein
MVSLGGEWVFDMKRQRSPQTNPQITIVLSTYDRPDALNFTIQSVRAQTVDTWRLLVIGDACGPETEKVVQGFRDNRIAFVNLPERCGEQSGPNSVGLALADSDFVALLNHDDIWLPNHLEVGLRQLSDSRADLFVSRAAFSIKTPLESDRLTFTEISPPTRSLMEAFWRPFFYIEPASSWMLSQRAAKRLGPWQSSLETCRTPLESWFLRAWRLRMTLVSTDAITVVKPRMMHGYDEAIPGHEQIVAMALSEPTRLRELMQDDVRRSLEAGLSRPFIRPEAVAGSFDDVCRQKLTPFTAQLFRWTGYDVLAGISEKFNVHKGHVLRSALTRRTGENLVTRPDLDGLVANARQQLASVKSRSDD